MPSNYLSALNQRRKSKEIIKSSLKKELEKVLSERQPKKIVQEHTLKKVNSLSEIDIGPTPDILDGHFDGMCIQQRDTSAGNVELEEKPIDKEISAKKNKTPTRLTRFLSILYKFVHLASCLVSLWMSKRKLSNWMADLVLVNACLVFSFVTLFQFVFNKKLDIIGSIVGAGWILIYTFGSYKTQDSRFVRMKLLTSLSCIGAAYILVESLYLIFNFFKFLFCKNENDGNVQVKPNENETFQEDCEEVACVEPERQPTPDILKGHFDAMCIQRRNMDVKSKEGKYTNHVTSALKYKTSPSPTFDRAPGQILKPATFTGRSILRPAVFSSTSSNIIWKDKRKFTNSFSSFSNSDSPSSFRNVNSDSSFSFRNVNSDSSFSFRNLSYRKEVEMDST